eukprot:3316561-Rhodomonas_salina.2
MPQLPHLPHRPTATVTRDPRCETVGLGFELAPPWHPLKPLRLKPLRLKPLRLKPLRLRRAQPHLSHPAQKAHAATARFQTTPDSCFLSESAFRAGPLKTSARVSPLESGHGFSRTPAMLLVGPFSRVVS